MPQTPDAALADAVRIRREQRGISQEALASEAGISTSSVSRIERGLMNPQWTLVRTLAGVLGLTISELSLAVEQVEAH
ncbi:MAG: helix-turn-helix domain-containing protein [Solirubrobacteraceae bacterium]